MNEVTLMAINLFLAGAESMAKQFNLSFPDTHVLTGKHVEYYEHYRQQYRKEVEERLAEAASESSLDSIH